MWAELRECASALGLEGAYFLLVPSFEPGGARVAAAASARIRPLMETFSAGRNPEVAVAIRSGFSGSEPGVWRPEALMADLPLPLRRARQAWMERAAADLGRLPPPRLRRAGTRAGRMARALQDQRPQGPDHAGPHARRAGVGGAVPSGLRADATAAGGAATDRARGRRPATGRRGTMRQEGGRHPRGLPQGSGEGARACQGEARRWQHDAGALRAYQLGLIA